MSLQIQEITPENLNAEIEAGNMMRIEPGDLMRPEEFPQYVDCGDKRPLTDEVEKKRGGELPARFLGSSSGLALVALNAYGIQSDKPYRDTLDLLKDIEEDFVELSGSSSQVGIVAMSARISDGAYRKHSTKIYVHSADSVEEHPRSIKDDIDDDLGCALMASYGKVVSNGADPLTKEHSSIVAEFDENGIEDDDIEAAVENSTKVLAAIGGEKSKVDRKLLLPFLRYPALKTPVAMVKGKPKITPETSLIVDLRGYKIRADGKRYAHSVGLAEKILPSVFNQLKLDRKALRASSLTLAIATQQTLGVQNTEVIPA